jgi:uncharacterized protein
VISAIGIGLLAGVLSGLLGIGGGALFVPALVVFAGLGHLDAEATSLLAIVPVALVGAWRQRAYGNLRSREAVALGVLGVCGAALGVVVANAVPERVLEVAFGLFLLVVAVQLARQALVG